MRRMRLLLLGKCGHILVNKPSVEIEDHDDYELAKWEHCANDLAELDISLVTKTVSEDLDTTEVVTEFRDDDRPVLDQVEDDLQETDEEIADIKKSNCSYQVRNTQFFQFPMIHLKYGLFKVPSCFCINWPFCINKTCQAIARINSFMS